MTNTENDNKKQSNNIKEETGKFLDQQKQQIENTVSNISDTTNRVTNSVNEYQQTNREILDKSIDTTNKYQQETNNTIQSITNNTIELQRNFANTFQSVFSKFIDDTSKSFWNNFLYPQRYTDVYNKSNQNVTDNTVNATRRINYDVVLASTETFNKSIEIAQKYYSESVQNYFNFVNKIEKSYYNH
jgi:ABC-type transporter Mla subunit MlaD